MIFHLQSRSSGRLPLDHVGERQAVRAQYPFRAAVATGSEQFERAPAVGPGARGDGGGGGAWSSGGGAWSVP